MAVNPHPLTLVVLAAGMGSRYGGLKQMESVGPHGESIMDYALFDALEAGFGKLVFVIRRDFESAFREKIEVALAGRTQTAYVYQDVGDQGYPHRNRPWGTGHAVLTARGEVAGPFAVINADDYYGREALRLIVGYLQNLDAGDTLACAMVGYLLRNTLSPHGTVCRGICSCNGDGTLRQVEEVLELHEEVGHIVGQDGDGQPRHFTGQEVVSLNLWGFREGIFSHFAYLFNDFLEQHGRDSRREFYIPTVVDTLIQREIVHVKVLRTSDTWFGVTHPPDREAAAARIRQFIQMGVYPEALWFS